MPGISRRSALLSTIGSAALTGACASGRSEIPDKKARHFVLVHGAWHGAWSWQKVSPLLRQAGHTVSTPTLSGLGERAHLMPGTSGLAVHVQDIVSHLEMEDLREVVLVGHSYAGCVVSGVLGERTSRVAHAIYVDAFVPMRGQSMSDFLPAPVRDAFQKLAATDAVVPVPPEASWGERWGLTDQRIIEWARSRLTPQAARSFVEKVQGDPLSSDLLRSFLKCSRNPNPGFKAIAEAIRKDRRYRYQEVVGHHDVMMTDAPAMATALLGLT